MVTYDTLRRDAAINTYITRADESLSALGFTEHSFPHVCRVAELAGRSCGRWAMMNMRSSWPGSLPISTISAIWSTGWITPRAGR